MARVSRVQPHLPWTEVNRHYRPARRPAPRRHWLIILSLQADPRPAEVAARQLGVSRSSVNHVVGAYNRLGPAALAPSPGGPKAPRAYLSRAEEAAFLSGFLRPGGPGPTERGGPLRRALEARLGHPVHPRTLERLLARHRWRKVVARPRHPKADAAVEAAHKKNLPAQARALVGDDPRPVVLMAQDEGRFGRISEARRCWAPPGVRPTCPRQVVRESLYVFAAIAPASGEMSALSLPHCDTQAMKLFLQTLSGAFAGRLVLLQTDRAGGHQSAALQVPDKVRLFYQPAHSPELNPVRAPLGRFAGKSPR